MLHLRELPGSNTVQIEGSLMRLNGREFDDWVVAAIAERKSSKMRC